jgi:uncharacterized protein
MPIDQDALERLRRLRSLGVRRGAQHLVRPEPPPPPAPEVGPGARLPGEPVDTPYGPAWVATTRYPLAQRPDLAAALAASPDAVAALGQDPGFAALDLKTTAFVDTETTGLSLGTGTYTFLIGAGCYESAPEPCFVVRQFFMRNPAEERAQLHLVEEILNRCTGLVSFNGRAFDMPLIQNRFTLAYLPPPLPGAPHLDLLPPARRIWRARLGSCALGELERRILGVQRTAADVPGWMIPGIYRDYYQGGAQPETQALMARVFYHNLQDIVSMALLVASMAQLFEPDGLLERLNTLHPLECASLARCYHAVAWHDAGISAYRVALGGNLPEATRLELLRELAELLKRTGKRAEAAELWETWITSAAGDDLTPYLELAKHHEWHTRDLAAARGWAAWALSLLENRPASAIQAETAAELRRRLERLERKLGSANGTS